MTRESGGRRLGRGESNGRLRFAALLLGLALVPPIVAGEARAQSGTTGSGDPAPQAVQPQEPKRVRTGLVTIESDLQRADQSTGVITASGNVRIVYPDQRVVATARQAQYYSREGRVVLSGDVDIVQEGGNMMRAEQVIYLVDRDRLVAIPNPGQQVYSRFSLPARQGATRP